MSVEIYPEINVIEDNNSTPEDLTRKLNQRINQIAVKEGFIKYQIDQKPLNTNGNNILGILSEIDIKGKTKDGDKELNIFVKSIMGDRKDLEVLNVSNVFKTELFVYKELSKLINELQDEANVPSDERYKMVKTYDETDSEIIIMENLSKRGFTTGHRLDEGVTLKFAEKAFQELAKLHAFSFVIKQKRPEYYETEVKTLKSAFILGETWQRFAESMCIISIDQVDEEVKERLKKFCVGIADRFGRNYKDETIARCLCHGDYKTSNLMTKMIDGEVSEMIPLDYQFLYFGCPIFDIQYFIFSCTDREFRKAHLLHLKDLYHESLTKFLKYFDIDVNLVYSREDFDKEYREKLDHGLMLSLLLFPLMFVAEEDVPDPSNVDISEVMNFRVEDKFKYIIREIVEDYIEWGIL